MQKILLFILIIISLVPYFNCSKKKDIQKIEKKAFIIDSKGEESVFSNDKIKDKSQIRTEAGSVIEIKLDDSRKLFLNELTTVSLDIEKKDDGSLGDINVNLLKGEVYQIKSSSEKAFSLTTDEASVIGDVYKIDALLYKDQKVLVVKTMENDLKIFPSSSPQVDVNECKKILIKGNGEVSNSISVTSKDIDELNRWIPSSYSVESRCLEIKETVVENKKPEWIGKFKRKVLDKELFVDTAKAKDPEGKGLTYYIEKGPKGLVIDKKSGIITYKNPISGTYKVIVVVQDEDGENNSASYFLTVPGKVQAVLDCQENIVVNQKLKLDASESKNAFGEGKDLLYRFDANGDNKWDEEFNSISFSETVFSKPGKYKVKVEIKDKENKKSIAEILVNVVEELKSKISHKPKVGKVGSEFNLTAEVSNKANCFLRWDLNNDGKWDIPLNGEFGNAFTVKNILDKKGKHIVKVEIKNDLQTITIYDTLTVYDGVVIDSIQVPDTVSVNEKVKVKCFARDEKNKITEYAWDFAGVGLFDKKSTASEVETLYKKGGIYTIVCAVTNDANMSVSDMKEIVVVNADATVAAGGPYSTTVNKEVLIRSIGRDPDSKIVEYLWDLDFDGKFEIKQNSTTGVKAKYSRAGDHQIVFGITTDDGKKMFDTSFVKVSNRAPHAEAGEDQVSRSGKKIKLNGIGKDPDNNIEKYEWDFNEDGKYEFSSKDSGYTEYKFEKFTKVVLRVTDQEGLSSTDTMKIVICPKGMVINEDGKFCIDKYEYPNTRKKVPVTKVTQQQAAKECAKVGKRLCEIKELELACTNGNDRFNYPYGKRYEEYNCNTVDSKKTDNRISWSGQYNLCVTKDGIFDMTGNVAEWAAETDGKFGYAVGGWWQDGREGASCGKYVKMNKNNRYGHIGFRCCK